MASRKKYLSDPANEVEPAKKIMTMKDGAKCEVCNVLTPEELSGSDENILQRYSECHGFVHHNCLYGGEWTTKVRDDGTELLYCFGCSYTMENKSSEDYMTPQCHMCNQPNGILLHAYAEPINKKRWKDKAKLKRSLFGLKIWCHPTCGV